MAEVIFSLGLSIGELSGEKSHFHDLNVTDILETYPKIINSDVIFH